MRKVKALELLAAASIAAVPTVGFADDVAVMRSRPQVRDRGQINPFIVDFRTMNTGRFNIVRNHGLSGGPEADGTFTWVGPDDGTWNQNANWLPNTGFPDGSNATAIFNHLGGGGLAQMTANTTLSNLTLTDPLIAAIGGPSSGASVTMTMTNNRTISAAQIKGEAFPFTPTFFGAAIGLPAGTSTPARPVVIGGSSGLIVDGLGAAGLDQTGKISIRFPNTYTGGTTIQNGGQVTLLNQVDISTAFGASGDITLNRGKIWVEVDNGVMDRNITVVGPGNDLTLGTDPANTGGSTQTFNGNIAGLAGSRLLVNGDFGGRGNFTANNTFAGTLDVGFGTHVLSGSGAFANVAALNNAGTLVLQGDGANRLSDTAVLTMHAAALRMNNYTGTETIGNMRLRGGTSAVIMQGGSGTLSAGSLVRENKGGLEIQANGLSSSNKVFFSNGTSQLTSGVFQYVFGHAQDPFIVGISSQFTEVMTYTANGVTPISAAGGYAENVYTPGANVRLQSTTLNEAFAVPGGTTTINSLTLAPGFDGGGNGVNGVFVSGNGTLNISGGVLLSAFDGFTPGNLINSGVGNVIEAGVTLTTPASELVLNAPGALTTHGKISGNFGVTKLGIRTWFNNGTLNDYTGETVLSGFNRHKGDILINQPGPYGSSSTAIILDGNNRIQNDPGLGNTGIFGVSFGPDATNTGPTVMNRPLLVRGNAGRNLIISQIRNFSAFGFTMNGPITVEEGADLSFVSLNGADQPYTINSVISGNGHVSAQQLQANLKLVLNGQNTFTGGFELAGGLVTAGVDTVGFADAVTSGPFGTGVVVVSGGTFNGIQANAPRTIGNNFIINAGSFSVEGTNPITFSGNIDWDPSGSSFRIVDGNQATFSGVMAGGSFFKSGLGTMNITGNNTIDGQINAGNGTLEGGLIVYRSNGAAGSSVGASAANFGNNAIALAGGITVGQISSVPGDLGELMVIRGEGVGGLGALRNLSGNNTWQGFVIIQQTNNPVGVPQTTKGTIGVDGAGDTLTITGPVLTSAIALNPDGTTQPANPLGIRKVGPGTLSVRSISASGSIEIAQGRLQFGNVSSPEGSVPSVTQLPVITFAGGPSAPTAQLNLGRNVLIVDYTGSSPLSDLQAYIAAGKAGGTWTGNGITSLDLIGIPPTRADLHAFESPAAGTFLGTPVDGSAVFVFAALKGDANLDWRIFLSDFNILAANFGQAHTPKNWTQANFDSLVDPKTGVAVNLQDFNILAGNFGFTAGPDGPTPEDWAALYSAVPEPGSLGVLAVAGLGLLQRRRRPVVTCPQGRAHN